MFSEGRPRLTSLTIYYYEVGVADLLRICADTVRSTITYRICMNVSIVASAIVYE